MDKKFLIRIIFGAVILAAAIMWLLSVIPATSEMFAWFSLTWTVAMIAGALGIQSVLAGVFSRNNVVVKKFTIIFGALFLVIAFFCVVWVLALPEDMIAPTIAIIITGALFLGLLATGGKKWDSGDNQKVGYQNYHQRKKAEEKHH